MQNQASDVSTRFTQAIRLPVLAAMLITAATAIALVAWTTQATDERARERQTRTVAGLLQRELDGLASDQRGLTVWEAALVHSSTELDGEWLHHNVGLWAHSYFQHDWGAVIGADDQVRYVMHDGHNMPLSDYTTITNAAAPLVDELRAVIAGGALASFYADSTNALPQLRDFAMIDGQPAMVSVSPIVTDLNRIFSPSGEEPVHVAVRILDETVAESLQSVYMLEDPEFERVQARQESRASFAVSDRRGRIVTFLTWQPERPGTALLAQIGPALGLAFFVVSILVFMLLRRLSKSSSEIEQSREAAEHRARHDALTGLYNRKRFDEELARTLGEDTGRALPVSLLMLDLDRFKQVNDTLGHQAGDELITIVARRIEELVEPSDVLARLGGDEFALIVRRGPGSPDVDIMAQAIIDSIAKPFEVGGSTTFVGCSIGIVTSSAASVEAVELVRKADIALYEAKAAGRNRAVVFQERMNDKLQLQREIEAELRVALEAHDQLKLVFQPLIKGGDRQLIGAEALMRWNHPRYGMIPPTRFIAVAENSGQIEALGIFALREACRLGAQVPGMKIAVNISPIQLRSQGFARQVMTTLSETGMRATDLELEVTESVLIDDERIFLRTLDILRAAGVRVALDDFGTGYSSLGYLHRYPVDQIKIDKAFIGQLGEKPQATEIIRAIVTLAHAVETKVTAEGVETKEQLAILEALGCDMLQGYFFSKPVDVETMLTWFNETLADKESSLSARVA